MADPVPVVSALVGGRCEALPRGRFSKRLSGVTVTSGAPVDPLLEGDSGSGRRIAAAVQERVVEPSERR